MDGSHGIKDSLLDNESPEGHFQGYRRTDDDASSRNSSEDHYPEGYLEGLEQDSQKGDDEPPPTQDPINHIAVSKELFDNWRLYRLLYSVFAVLAIIPAGLDYEESFDPNRRGDNPVKYDIGEMYRLMTLILSFIGIFLLIAYRISYFEWMRHLPKTFKDLPPGKQLPLIEYLNLRKPFKPSQYLGDEVPMTIVLLLIFPYPGIDFSFCLSQQMNYVPRDVCYYFSEILYAIMYLRFYLLVTGVFIYGKYFNPIAMRIGEKHGVRVTSNFAIKCYVNRQPLAMLLFLFLIPAVFVFGLLMRIFERPLMLSYMDFDYVGNAWWNIIITMTTVGYGDTFPNSNIGRLVVAGSAFWGGIILSLTFSTMSTFLQLKSNEQKALNSIIITSVACDAISSVVANKRGKGKTGIKDLWGKVRERLIVLKEYKQELLNQDQLTESTENISIRLFTLEEKTEKIKKLMEELHQKVDNKLA